MLHSNVDCSIAPKVDASNTIQTPQNPSTRYIQEFLSGFDFEEIAGGEVGGGHVDDLKAKH